MAFDLEAHLTRQMVFSRATFGPGARTEGVIDHIGKELREVIASKGSDRIDEWVDVAILALDGLTREVWAQHPRLAAHEVARSVAFRILAKQSKNERRDWPDWRTAAPGKAIEHVRGKED